MRKLQMLCLAAVLTAVFSLPALAVIYNGNYMTTMPNNEFAGKVSISDDGRMWSSSGQYVMIVRGDKNISWTLLPITKTYTVQPISLNSSASVSMKIKGEIGREKIGNELVNTIECEKYKVTCKAGKKKVVMYQWISADYPFPIKAATVDGKWSMELSQLQVVEEAGSIFEIPADYKKE